MIYWAATAVKGLDLLSIADPACVRSATRPGRPPVFSGPNTVSGSASRSPRPGTCSVGTCTSEGSFRATPDRRAGSCRPGIPTSPSRCCPHLWNHSPKVRSPAPRNSALSSHRGRPTATRSAPVSGRIRHRSRRRFSSVRKVVAALTVSGPAIRMPRERCEEWVDLLVGYAEQIPRTLGPDPGVSRGPTAGARTGHCAPPSPEDASRVAAAPTAGCARHERRTCRVCPAGAIPVRCIRQAGPRRDRSRYRGASTSRAVLLVPLLRRQAGRGAAFPASDHDGARTVPMPRGRPDHVQSPFSAGECLRVDRIRW